MSDQQKAILSLTLVRETCTRTLASFNSKSTVPGSGIIDLSTLRGDLISLLTLIYNATTKLSIALKGSTPSWSACLTPLKELDTNVAALTHCVSLLEPDLHGLTITEEVVNTLKEMLESLVRLVQLFLDVALGRGEGREYLVKTGEVHDLTERAKEISRENVEAVSKRLNADVAALEDALRELNEMIEDEHGAKDEDEEADDGWAQLGLASSKMQACELERAKKVHALLRCTNLLQKRTIRLLAQARPSNATLDRFPRLSSAVLVTADELVSSLYAPQDHASILAELKSWVQNTKALEGALMEALSTASSNPSLEQRMENVSLDGATSLEGEGPLATEHAKRKGRLDEQWFATCLKQIYLISETLIASLAPGAMG